MFNLLPVNNFIKRASEKKMIRAANSIAVRHRKKPFIKNLLLLYPSTGFVNKKMALRIVIISGIISSNTYESLKIDNLISLSYKKWHLACHEIVLVSRNIVIVSSFL